MDWFAKLLELEGDGPGYLAMSSRAVLVFTTILLIARVGARRFFAKLNAMDMITAIMIGSIGSRAITGNSPFGPALLSIAALVLLHWLFSFISYHTDWAGKWLKGQPILLVEEGKQNKRAMSRCKITRRDLEACMRSQGLSGGMDCIQQAWMERDGSISILTKDS